MAGYTLNVAAAAATAAALLLFAAASMAAPAPPEQAADDLLEIFMVPHSHDDTGWQRTVDQYFSEEVRFTYDSVVSELLEDPSRRFIFVEMAYMARWWALQSNATKENVRMLIREGRVEIVNGGWCMADNANPHVEGLINQLTVGHTFAAAELGTLPRVAWHIDPFGLTSTLPAIFRDLNYTDFVINRIDFRLKDFWKGSQNLQFTWMPSASRGADGAIFTHVLDSHYSAPGGFDYEYFFGLGGNDMPGATSNPPVTATATSLFALPSAPSRAAAFADEMRTRSAWFRTKNLLVPFGDDFKYQNARIQFTSLDALIAELNGGGTYPYGVRARYATPSEYFAALRSSSKPADFPVYTSDFFPYSSSPDASWTGYFTSRSQQKSDTRSAMAALHAAEAVVAVGAIHAESLAADKTAPAPSPTAAPPAFFLEATTDYPGNDMSSSAQPSMAACQAACAAVPPCLVATYVNGSCFLKSVPARPTFCPLCTSARRALAPAVSLPHARQANAVARHHDAITGTSLPPVVEDFKNRLATSMSFSARATAESILSLASAAPDPSALSPHPWLLPAVDVAAGVHSPGSASAQAVIVVHNPVGWARTEVVQFGLAAAAASFHLRGNTTHALPAQVDAIPTSGLPYRASVLVSLPPLGFVTITVGPPGLAPAAAAHGPNAANPNAISNNLLQVVFDGSGRLQAINGTSSAALTMDVLQYQSDGSDAYQFQPSGPAMPVHSTPPSNHTFVRGAAVEELFAVYPLRASVNKETLVALQYSVFAGASIPYFRLRATVAPAEDSEVVARFQTPLATNGTFFTDNNAQEIMQRTLGQTGWPNGSISDPISGNYYPSAAMLLLRDGAQQFTVVRTRANGVTSLANGQAEIMLHRRCAEKGGIPLNDTDIVAIDMFVVLEQQPVASATHRRLPVLVGNPPLTFFQTAAAGAQVAVAELPASYSVLKRALPPNVHLLTLQRVEPTADTPAGAAAEYLLRLQHLFAVGEHPQLAQPVALNLADMFVFPVANLRETILSGLATKTGGASSPAITLNPLTIRTFRFTAS